MCELKASGCSSSYNTCNRRKSVVKNIRLVNERGKEFLQVDDGIMKEVIIPSNHAKDLNMNF